MWQWLYAPEQISTEDFPCQAIEFQRLLLCRPLSECLFLLQEFQNQTEESLSCEHPWLCIQGSLLLDSWRTREMFVYSKSLPRGAVSVLWEVGDLLPICPPLGVIFVVLPKVSISALCVFLISCVCHGLTRMKSSGTSDFPALPKPRLVAMAADYSWAELDADGWNHLWHVINHFNSLLLSNEIQ